MIYKLRFGIEKTRGFIGKKPYIFYWINEKVLLRIKWLVFFKCADKWGIRWLKRDTKLLQVQRRLDDKEKFARLQWKKKLINAMRLGEEYKWRD